MSQAFIHGDPSLASAWRAILLFGRNAASYKFALAEALLSLNPPEDSLIKLEDLALPFIGPLCAHLREFPRQSLNPRSAFLDACRAFDPENADPGNRGEMIDKVVRHGFVDVIDAFHALPGGAGPHRFFIDERRASRGIRLTDEFYRLKNAVIAGDLTLETESRWKLVETAWSMNIPRHALVIQHNPTDETLVTPVQRRAITRTRQALNGYQKGKCFYCNQDLAIGGRGGAAAEVDHFLPHALARNAPISYSALIDGVWNLVLACKECNGRKGDQIPAEALLGSLHRRNEFLIASHHPLRETLILQTGKSPSRRSDFLRAVHHEGAQFRGGLPWSPKIQAQSPFPDQ